MAGPKQEIITFKVDASLASAMQGIPNRSAFIRAAILAALDDTCPLCKGSGAMTPEQRSHWQVFTTSHNLVRCGRCDAFHLVCGAGRSPEVHE